MASEGNEVSRRLLRDPAQLGFALNSLRDFAERRLPAGQDITGSDEERVRRDARLIVDAFQSGAVVLPGLNGDEQAADSEADDGLQAQFALERREHSRVMTSWRILDTAASKTQAGIAEMTNTSTPNDTLIAIGAELNRGIDAARTTLFGENPPTLEDGSPEADDMRLFSADSPQPSESADS